MRIFLVAWFAALLLGAGTATSWGQRTTADAIPSGTVAASEGSIPVIRQDVREIRLVVTATDRHGRFVRNLGPGSFDVLDDGQAVGAYLAFRAQANLPLEVGMVIDLSGSVRGRFPFEKESVSQFLRQVLHPGTDHAFVAGFNKEVTVQQGFTDNQTLLSQAVGRLQAGGGTGLFDAIVKLCRQQWPAAAGAPVRRAIMLVTDGNDNQSEATLAAAIEAAQRAEVIVYAVNPSDSPTVEKGDKVLNYLAEATGGRVFYPASRHDMNRAFAEAEEELRSQYVLSFRPVGPGADGKFHALTLLPHVTGVQLRTRRGYYAR